MCNPADIIAPLIGSPWQRGATGPDAWDCWSLAAHLQRELMGRELPLDPAHDLDSTDPRAVIEAIKASPLQRQWLAVARPAHGDLVLMARRGNPAHVGVYVTGDVPIIVHCQREAGVIAQSPAAIRAAWPTTGYRRPAHGLIDAVSKADQTAFKAGFNGAEALAIVVRDPAAPLVGAELVPVASGAAPGDVLINLAPYLQGRIDSHWLILGDTPLLRRNPVSGEDETRTRRLGRGDVLWVCPPPPEGDDGSSVLTALASIALMVAAPYASAALGLTGMAGKLLTAGLTIGGNLLLSAFSRPSSTLDAPIESASPTYTLTPPGNQMRPGGQIPRLYGTVRRQPDLLAPPWGQFDDNEHDQHILLCIGTGAHRINEIGIGDTAVWHAGEGETVGGNGVELFGPDAPQMTGAIEAVTIEVVPPGQAVTLFPETVAVSEEVGGQDLAHDVVSGPFTAVPVGQRANRLDFDLAFASGLFGLADDGAMVAAAVTWTIEAREIDDSDVALGPWLTLDTPTVTFATPTPRRLTYGYVVTEGRYEVRLTRTSPSTITDGRGQDTLSWVGLKAFIPGNQRFDDVTVVAIRSRATETSPQAQSRWYVDATAILPYWDGSEWVTGPTEGIEAAVRDIVTASYGLDLPLADLDTDTLEALAGTWAARGDVCCLAVDTAQSAWEVLSAVLRTGRARPVLIGSTVTAVRDAPRAFPVQLITHADIVRGSLEVVRHHYRRESPNAVSLRYWDRSGTMREIACIPPGVTGPRTATVDLPGVVDREQAWREGVTLAAANNLRRTAVSFVMLGSGRVLMPGDLIAVSHPRPGYGRPGRVVAMQGLTLTLSEPHGIEGGDDHYMRLSTPDGGHWGPVLVVSGADDHTLAIDAADLDAIIAAPATHAGYGNDPRHWITAEADLMPAGAVHAGGGQREPTRAAVGKSGASALQCVVTAMRPRSDGTVEVAAVIEDAGVHTAETGVIPAAPVPSSLSPIADAPVWTGVTARIDDRAGTLVLMVGGPAIPGAVTYIMEVSVDDGATWSRVAGGPAPVLEAPAPAVAGLQVRAAAVGTLRGPWASFVLDGSSARYPLAPLTGLTVSEPPEFGFRWRWTAVPTADRYDVEIIVGGVLERVAQASIAAYDYPLELQELDGGPWREATIRVRAVRGETLGAWVSSDDTNPPPTALAAPTVSDIAATSATVSWLAPADTPDGYRVRATRVLDSVENEHDAGTALTYALTDLEAATDYDIAVAAHDGITDGLDWSPETRITTGAAP